MDQKLKVLCAIFSILAFSNCTSNIRPGEFSSNFSPTDSLPLVLPLNKSDLIDRQLRYEAAMKFAQLQLPSTIKEWEVYRTKLRNEVIKKANIRTDHKLPLNIKETGSMKMKNYVIKNITFQTLPGVYATANLFIPDGPGPFPAVINMVGHFDKVKIDGTGPQGVGHSLASSGYVCLTMDFWGAGERSTKNDSFEYHGSNLGASLMNIGEPLIGVEISENMRGVDLLCALPVVDTTKIGATGASGGGNQTMWLAAVDNRIKADVPVVSVGTFESYIMGSNCICETLPGGLTFTEESGILALSNAVLLLNHENDNPTFLPSEMLRSYMNARHIFKLEGRENNISYHIFDLPHGYMNQDREAMLGWFDLHLKGKGDGSPAKEIPFTQLAEEKLLVFKAGERDANVITTEQYCIQKGEELRSKYLAMKSFNTIQKESELKNILRIDKKLTLDNVSNYSPEGGWERISLETTDRRLIPLLYLAPLKPSLGYVIICHSNGKKAIPLTLVDEYKKRGSGIVIADLSGTGELTSLKSAAFDNLAGFHTLSRAELWLGKTVIGEWVKEIDLINQFLKTRYKAEKVTIDGTREAGLAGLFYASLGGKVAEVTLREAPVSYLFDNRESIDHFSMAIHLPGFLNWGDVSLAAALTGLDINLINPVTMSGRSLDSQKLNEFRSEYENIRKLCRMKGKTTFN
jgi:hypothetical protein